MSNTAARWFPAQADRDPHERAGGENAGMPELAPALELALSDLVQDAGGEVVLYNDSGMRALGLVAAMPIVGEGRASRHVTASGDDVTGFRYVSFANGMTLYFQDGLDLVVRSD
jgi:hypothetical protein